MLIQSMKPNTDADLLMARMGIVPTPPPTVNVRTDGGLERGLEGPTAEQGEVLEVAREEVEQPLLTPEEVVANLAAGDAEVTKETMEMRVENPTERVNDATDEEGRTKGATPTPTDDTARARAETVHIYQRRPVREEASRKKYTEGQQKGTPGKKAEGSSERPEGRAVELPRRRRRLLDEEPDEAEEEVVFTLIEALPSSGQPAPPAEKKDSEREQRERKRKGKTVAAPESW